MKNIAKRITTGALLSGTLLTGYGCRKNDVYVETASIKTEDTFLQELREYVKEMEAMKKVAEGYRDLAGAVEKEFIKRREEGEATEKHEAETDAMIDEMSTW